MTRLSPNGSNSLIVSGALSRDMYLVDGMDPEDVSLIWPNFRAFEMCFTYGVEAEIERGKGEIVYMRLVGETELGRAGDL